MTDINMHLFIEKRMRGGRCEDIILAKPIIVLLILILTKLEIKNHA